MKENGNKVFVMDKVNKFGQMVHRTQVNGLLVMLMASKSLFMLMEIHMRDFFATINLRVKEFTCIKMVSTMKAVGKLIINMEKAKKFGMMETLTMVNMKKV
jgi:hypothetical protein